MQTQLSFKQLVHADWSVHPAGRWRVAAKRISPGGWRIAPAVPVGGVTDFLARLQKEAGDGPTLLGVDLPIGAPKAWATQAGIQNFRTALSDFGRGRWSKFYEPATSKAEIGLFRPFYPLRPGGTSQNDLVAGLGLKDRDALRRTCDFDVNGKRGACPLFWTLGGNQVGRAAGAFWRDVLGPALVADLVALWPFDGALAALAVASNLTVAETYPAEVYRWFDLEIAKPKQSKRNLAHRQADAAKLLAKGASFGAAFSPDAENQIRTGFPDGKDDAFDAMVGLLGLIAVVEGRRPEYAPAQGSVAATVEGWILGRAPATA